MEVWTGVAELPRKSEKIVVHCIQQDFSKHGQAGWNSEQRIASFSIVEGNTFK